MPRWVVSVAKGSEPYCHQSGSRCTRARELRMKKTSAGRTHTTSGSAAVKVAQVCSFIRESTGTPQLVAARPRRRGACCLMVLLDPGSAAGAPAVLGWSSPSTALTLPVSGQSRVVNLMLHPGRRRPWLASGAHVKNKLITLRQAQQSRPGPPTDRRRSSLPHGKATRGCRASLPPAWCTAGAAWARSGPLPAAVRTHGGRPTASLGTGLAPPP